jgi:outer membrane protein assembly factor BamA
MWGRLTFALVTLVALTGTALAAPPEPGDPDSRVPEAAPPPPDAEQDTAVVEPALHEDNEFGPVVMIEQIDVAGNTATQTEIIRRALPISVGDVLHASDKRLREARFKVLALGFFRDVALAIRRGSQRGQVIVEVRVVERGTLVLNRLWFGTTSLSPWWLGADVGDRNLLGLGIAVGGGFIYAHQAQLGDPNQPPVEGQPAFDGRNQYAAELRLSDPSVRGTPWGASWAITLVHGSEPYQVTGDAGDTDETHMRAFPYRRFGVRAGATYNVSALTRLSMGLRAESIDATLPIGPTRVVGTSDLRIAIDPHLDPGASRVVTASFGFDRDTRPDPILPHAGARILASAELGSALLGGSYDFATMFASYEQYWPVHGDKHAIGIKLAGGVVVGDAPRFDRIHIADVDRMLTPRALGLVLSTAAPLSILTTRSDKPIYGDLGGTATIEYAVQLFRGSGKQRVYGGDVFFGAGLWGLAERQDLRARDTGFYRSLPIDVYLDAGLRIDTDIGTFELTVANALGRLR